MHILWEFWFPTLLTTSPEWCRSVHYFLLSVPTFCVVWLPQRMCFLNILISTFLGTIKFLAPKTHGCLNGSYTALMTVLVYFIHHCTLVTSPRLASMIPAFTKQSSEQKFRENPPYIRMVRCILLMTPLHSSQTPPIITSGRIFLHISFPPVPTA